ncbi:MAG TPA: Gfo/Idh/MocA family oxidoreductase [Solirubrobacteraceae bacterium]|nr:Gfo/Idh/MocA family oxidoreductase [Solirubrobacteraceae bacterium]
MSVNSTTGAGRLRARTPRLGFLGVGWIGRQRMTALARDGLADAVAVADTDPSARARAVDAVPGLVAVEDLPALLDAGLDGLVIATPSALHAEQARTALEHGVAVFCQKPLARTAAETRGVVDAARGNDLRLGVDLSYRHLRAAVAAQGAIERGELGEVYAAELVFHNAYGPDKPWFTDRRLSGGGCLIDLGTHLIDLVLWLTGGRCATVDSARLLARGRPTSTAPGSSDVEDFALAQVHTDTGVTARLACSWYLPVGRDCEIEFTIYGTEAAISIRNVDGSFYDFVAHRHRGTVAELIVEPPDPWGPRALAAWASALARGDGFDPEAESLGALAAILDDIYDAAGAT